MIWSSLMVHRGVGYATDKGVNRQSALLLLWGGLALCATARPAGHAYACEAQLDGNPLLGEYLPLADRRAAILLHVQQNDLDVQILVQQGERSALHNGPGGRNGVEWVYLGPQQATQIRVCIYAVYRQAAQRSYEISRITLSGLSQRQRDALRSMSDAGVLWATGTQEARVSAIAAYERVSNTGMSQFGLSDYAQLYVSLAKLQRYQYDEALRELHALAGNDRIADHIRYVAYWAIGSIFNRKADYHRSSEAIEKALQIAGNIQGRSKRSLRRDIAEMTNLLGEVHLSTGTLSLGEKLVREARIQSRDDNQLLGLVHNNLGYVHLLQADNDDVSKRAANLSLSLAEHFKARQHSLWADDRQELAVIENNLASLFERIGDLRKARQHYDEALSLIDKTDDPLRFQVLYRNLGYIYQYLGDYAKSEQFLTAAVQIAERAVPHDAIRLRCNLGTTQRLRGRVADAIAEHTVCATRAQAGRYVRLQAEALHELTVDYRLVGPEPQAWHAIEEATRLLPQIRDGDLTSKIRIQHALLLQKRGDAVAARNKALDAIAATDGARYPTTRVDALATAMILSAEQGRELEAMTYGFRAIAAIESLHAHLDAERLGPAWSARTHDVYARIAAMMLRSYQRHKRTALLWEALDVIERSRAISLRQQFSAPPSVLLQVEQSRILATLSEIASEHARSDTKTVSGVLPLAYYHEHDLLTLSRLAGTGDLPVPPPLSAKQLRSSLREGQTALYYFFSDDRAYLFLMSRTGLELVDLGTRHDIETLVAQITDALSMRHHAPAELLRKLSSAILPISALTGTREWIIARDRSLHNVPFSALHVGSAAGPYEPAISRYSIKLVPSLSAYLMLKPPRPTQRTIDIAVFADPVFGFQQRQPVGATKRFTGWTQSLRRLPWTAREAELLRGLFPADRTLIYTGNGATRENLRSERVRDARVLHIASHGYFRSDSPDNIGFALTAVENDRGIDSGFVTLAELFTYRFNNELVVISGCDTAMGMELAGEGMISLTRGFIAQGASHVISSLWAVPDKASAEFMAIFYARLLERGSVAEALRAAQWELSLRPRYRDPFYWASYVLTTVQPGERMEFSQRSLQTTQDDDMLQNDAPFAPTTGHPRGGGAAVH